MHTPHPVDPLVAVILFIFASLANIYPSKYSELHLVIFPKGW